MKKNQDDLYVVKHKEQAILVEVKLTSQSNINAYESLNELEQLVITAGGEVIERVVQERNSPDPRTFIGIGKAEEVGNLVEEYEADLVVLNEELSPSQQHNLEDSVSCKVLDRTALILDIFARRAHSKEGKLQVELAQHTYRLPRLRGKGIELSRLGGGIGTRGPGETKLEVDRRRIKKRIGLLKKELAQVRKNRALQRKKRKKSLVYSISLVGYTNAGKTTLLNALTGAHGFVEDKLFATLDSTTRRLSTANYVQIVISDTVGFIRDLPHQLIAAFRSTLDEVSEADLLLHIIDVSHPLVDDHIKAVKGVLTEIESDKKSQIEVFNKIDRLDDEKIEDLKLSFSDGVFISAKEEVGLEELLKRIESLQQTGLAKVSLFVPYKNRSSIGEIYEEGRILKEEHNEEGTKLVVEIPKVDLYKVKKFISNQNRKK